jgi:hypothetical protein
VSRRQAEALGCSKYEDGMEGLLAEKERRRAKAQDRYDTALAAYEAKLREAREGKGSFPKRPKRSHLLDTTMSTRGGFADVFPNACLLDTVRIRTQRKPERAVIWYKRCFLAWDPLTVLECARIGRLPRQGHRRGG